MRKEFWRGPHGYSDLFIVLAALKTLHKLRPTQRPRPSSRARLTPDEMAARARLLRQQSADYIFCIGIAALSQLDTQQNGRERAVGE